MNKARVIPPSFLRREVSSLLVEPVATDVPAPDSLAATTIPIAARPSASLAPTIKPLATPALTEPTVEAPSRLHRARQTARQWAMTVAPLVLLLVLVGVAQFATIGGTQAAAEGETAAPEIVLVSGEPSATPTVTVREQAEPTGVPLRPRPTLEANRLPLSVALAVVPRPTTDALRAQPEIRATPRPRAARGRPVEPGPWPEVPAGGAPSRVRAPSIGMDAPVETVGSYIENVGGAPVRFYETALDSAGWHDNSALPGHVGNVVMAGHHNIGAKVFEHVVDLEMGDYIFLDVGEQTYPYQVVLKEILPEANVSEAQRAENGRWINPTTDERLTLVTCWPPTDNSHRVIVVAYPVK